MNCTRRNWLLAVTSGLMATNSRAREQQQSWAYPGGIAVLRWPKSSPALPTVRFGLREPVLLDDGDHWRILIGLGLSTVPGDYVVYIKPGDSEEPAYPMRFEVVQKRYPVRALRAPLQVMSSEDATLTELDFSNSVPPAMPWRLPVAANWPDEFGQILVASNADDEALQQNYLSLPASALTGSTQVVQAPQNGIVSKIAQTSAFSQTIYIDHGRGLYSILSGLQELTVEVGNGVVAGAVIGMMTSNIAGDNSATDDSGAREAVTDGNASAGGEADSSPRRFATTLNWQCVMNRAYVNPLIVTQIQ